MSPARQATMLNGRVAFVPVALVALVGCASPRVATGDSGDGSLVGDDASEAGTSADASVVVDAGLEADAGAADGPSDAAVALDSAEGDSAPSATLLQSAAGLKLWGVTGDGWVVYRVGQTLSGTPVDGGAVVTIGQFAGTRDTESGSFTAAYDLAPGKAA